MDKQDLTTLVRLAQKGERDALEAVLEEIQRPVYYQCKKILQNEPDALDATQEILLSVVEKLDTLRQPDAFRGWVNRMTVNRCKNLLTRGGRELQFAEDEEGNSVLEDIEDLDEQAVPDKSLDNAETRRMVTDLVDALPPEQRLCVLMYYYNEMSVREIAETLSIPENTVKSRLNYARRSLKKGVLDYERQGIKLYSFSPLPFLLYFLCRDAESGGLSGTAARELVRNVLEVAAPAARGVAAGAASSGTVGAQTTAQTGAAAAQTGAATAIKKTAAAAVTKATRTGALAGVTGKWIAAAAAVAVTVGAVSGGIGFSAGQHKAQLQAQEEFTQIQEEARVQTATFDMSYDHAGLIDPDGTLWMWGESYYGQLGNDFGYDMEYNPGGTPDMITYQCGPVKVMEDVTSIGLGSGYTAALKADGSLWTWGDNHYGQLGNGYEGVSNLHSPHVQGTPGKIMDNVAQIDAGYDVMAAVKADGSLWMWGNADDGVLGNGGAGNLDDYYSGLIQTVPVKIMEDVAAVSVGFRFSAAIKTDGSLWMWGSNKYGQIVQGGAETILHPVKVMDGVAAVKVDGGTFNCAVMVIKTDGSLWLWGTNENGRLLPGGAEVITEPARFMENVTSVDIGSGGCAALWEDGSLWTWGVRQDGTTERTGLSMVMNGVAAMRMGTDCYGVLKTDGTVWLWGDVGILAGIAVENNDTSIVDLKSETPMQVSGLVGRLPQTRNAAIASLPDKSQT